MHFALIFKIIDLHQYDFNRLNLWKRNLNILVKFYLCNIYNETFYSNSYFSSA